MSAETSSHGCLRCGRFVATDVPRVGISFAPHEVAQLAKDARDPAIRERLLCALGTVDGLLEQVTRAEIELEQEVAREECPTCSEIEAARAR
jgi:hypothetical protein